MENALPFGEVLDAADKLTLEEQETLVDFLSRRLIEYRRSELAREIHDADQEFQSGGCRVVSPQELIQEILP